MKPDDYARRYLQDRGWRYDEDFDEDDAIEAAGALILELECPERMRHR